MWLRRFQQTMIRDDDQFLALIDSFQRAALDGNWYPALEALARATGSRSGQLIALGADATVPLNLLTDVPEEMVRQFVEQGGLHDATVGVGSFEVTDALAQLYRSGPVESRFVMAQTLVVRSPDVDGIAALAQRVGALVSQGVVLSSDGSAAGGPVYLFTALNDAKPEMVAEATRNARASAEQFAADSSSRLGGIRSASQGLFQILARDDAPGLMEPFQIAKRLRVVSTVEYFLAD